MFLILFGLVFGFLLNQYVFTVRFSNPNLYIHSKGGDVLLILALPFRRKGGLEYPLKKLNPDGVVYELDPNANTAWIFVSNTTAVLIEQEGTVVHFLTKKDAEQPNWDVPVKLVKDVVHLSDNTAFEVFQPDVTA